MSAPGAKAGLATAIAVATDAWAADQLLPDGSLRPSQPLLPLEGESFEAENSAEQGGTTNRGPGRPPGARNKSTEELLEAFNKRFVHPLWILGATWSRPVGVLARELACSKLKAFELQQSAAMAALPYTTKKLPQALEIDMGAFNVFLGGVAAGSGTPREAIDPMETHLLMLQSARKQFQEVNGQVTDATDDRATDDQAQAIERAGDRADQASDQRSAPHDAAPSPGAALDARQDPPAGPEAAEAGGAPPTPPALFAAGVTRASFSHSDALQAESPEKTAAEKTPTDNAGAGGGQ